MGSLFLLRKILFTNRIIASLTNYINSGSIKKPILAKLFVIENYDFNKWTIKR